MTTKTTAELIIGDVVFLLHANGELNDKAPFQQMTVVQATTKEVTFFRPYVTLSTFIHTGGAIPYIGIEQFTSPIGHHAKYMVMDNIYNGKQ